MTKAYFSSDWSCTAMGAKFFSSSPWRRLQYNQFCSGDKMWSFAPALVCSRRVCLSMMCPVGRLHILPCRLFKVLKMPTEKFSKCLITVLRMQAEKFSKCQQNFLKVLDQGSLNASRKVLKMPEQRSQNEDF